MKNYYRHYNTLNPGLFVEIRDDRVNVFTERHRIDRVASIKFDKIKIDPLHMDVDIYIGEQLISVIENALLIRDMRTNNEL